MYFILKTIYIDKNISNNFAEAVTNHDHILTAQISLKKSCVKNNWKNEARFKLFAFFIDLNIFH